MVAIAVQPHPLFDPFVCVARFPRPLGEVPAPPAVAALLRPGATAPMASDDAVRAAVRDLLRHGGFKPTGRSKPSSEYLLRAVGEGQLGAINAAVDVGNAVSYHSGLPISIVDLDRAVPPLSIAVSAVGEEFVFNQSGQVIDVGGLLGLRDAQGPCANAVKDAQRTKTDATTRAVLMIVWGTNALAGRAAQAGRWATELLTGAGAVVEVVVG